MFPNASYSFMSSLMFHVLLLKYFFTQGKTVGKFNLQNSSQCFYGEKNVDWEGEYFKDEDTITKLF